MAEGGENGMTSMLKEAQELVEKFKVEEDEVRWNTKGRKLILA